ncbi:LysR family transcriptional regulator [Pengzhenrongella sp.]|uniref:LysR substrate-binding domain-containing protein n=1 Tax=Pengzhenrongella sp. TaxID=2888820 RepID=UPI002F925E4D
MGQPGVSQQVARLERELEVQLFDRSARSVRLTEAGQRFLPEARAVLVALQRARASAAGPDDAGPGASRLRLGTSSGLGVRLEGVLEALRRANPAAVVQLDSASTRVRLERVRAGQLDAAFVRGIQDSPGLELVPVWRDSLVAVLPASHPLAATGEVELSRLATVPRRLVSRTLNAPLVDLVMSACARSGFEPVLGPRSQTLQDTLAAIGTGPTAWTVLYASHAHVLRPTRVVFRPFAAPRLVMTTALAVPAGATTRLLAPLLRACAEAAADDWSS